MEFPDSQLVMNEHAASVGLLAYTAQPRTLHC